MQRLKQEEINPRIFRTGKGETPDEVEAYVDDPKLDRSSLA